MDRYEREEASAKRASRYIMSGIALTFVLAGSALAGCPVYKVWQQGLAGEAKLREAEFSKRVTVEEAQAKLDSASLHSQAEVERAKGVAEANEIIGNSLRENEAYLRYLWIQGLHDGTSETIYIPTEANLPILEATRKTKPITVTVPKPE